MKKAIIMTLAFSAICISGCSLHQPQTAEEFRQAAPGAFMGKMETFEVNRPYRDVSDTFKKMAPRCLDTTIRTVSQRNTGYGVSTHVVITKWNPTVVVTKERTEMYVQQLHEQGVMNVSKVPEKGYFLMVVDATPVDREKTKIVMYRPSVGVKSLVKAIKGWASGEIKGCPDLTK